MIIKVVTFTVGPNFLGFFSAVRTTTSWVYDRIVRREAGRNSRRGRFLEND
jgi:hypothetical protein